MVGQVLISKKFYVWLAGSNLVLPTPNMSIRRYLIDILCFSFYPKMTGNKRYLSTVYSCFYRQFTSYSLRESCFHRKKGNLQYSFQRSISVSCQFSLFFSHLCHFEEPTPSLSKQPTQKQMKIRQGSLYHNKIQPAWMNSTNVMDNISTAMWSNEVMGLIFSCESARVRRAFFYMIFEKEQDHYGEEVSYEGFNYHWKRIL